MRASIVLIFNIMFMIFADVASSRDNDDPLKWTVVKVRYPIHYYNGMYDIPTTVSQLHKNRKFVLLGPNDQFPRATLYCYPNDPRVCPFYDSRGNIAGIRLAYLKSDIQKKLKKGDTFLYDYDNRPIYRTASAYGHDFYYIDTLFINPDAINNGGPEVRDEPVGDGIYLNIDGKGYKKMPRHEAKVKGDTFMGFTEQRCIPFMGKHYFYNVAKDRPCSDIQPPFLLYNDNGEGVGLGLIQYGTFSVKDRFWFEDVTSRIMKVILNHFNECTYDWADRYGSTGLHIYFISSLKSIWCYKRENKMQKFSRKYGNPYPKE